MQPVEVESKQTLSSSITVNDDYVLRTYIDDTQYKVSYANRYIENEDCMDTVRLFITTGRNEKVNAFSRPFHSRVD